MGHLRKWVRWSVLGLVSLALGANLLTYLQARAMTHFVPAGERTPLPEHLSFGGKLRVLLLGVRVPHPSNNRTPAALGLPFTTHVLAGEAGTLEAWSIPHPAARGLVILFHGYSESKKQVLLTARRFHDLGWATVLVDFRGSGGSQGDRTSIGYYEARDVAATIRWVREDLGEERPVLYGFSMGAAAILRSVAVEGVTPRALIVEASFDRMLSTIEHRFAMMHLPSFPMAQLLVFWGGRQNGFNAFSHNPVDYAAAVTCPTLVLHGANDQRVTQGEAQAIFGALRGPKTLHIFPGVGHEAGQSVPASDWMKVVRPFLDDLGSR